MELETLTNKKIALIGDGSCGKTSLLLAHLNNEKRFHKKPEPTVLDCVRIEIDLKQNNVMSYFVLFIYF